jgi:hypothetical protein
MRDVLISAVAFLFVYSCGSSGFTVIGAPTILAGSAGVSPVNGPVGTSITITGTNFTPDAKVTFSPCTQCQSGETPGGTAGPTAATCTPGWSLTQMVCTVPSGLSPGTYDETVTTAAGTAVHHE